DATDTADTPATPDTPATAATPATPETAGAPDVAASPESTDAPDTTDADRDVAAAGAGPVVNPGETAATAAPEDGQVAVSQTVIFYEERTNVDDGSAEPGNVVWTLVQESPGDGQPAEPAIHAEATVPGKDVELRLTIRRNADKTLPASHIVELIFLTP